jgi:hypothetical protein
MNCQSYAFVLLETLLCYTISSMADYKVPQDVEAEDKLIGPFSFRQFIYLIIVAMSIAAAWGLYLLFPLFIIIPLPAILLFGALALPLRKDQPMEIYLAAVVSYYLKPRKRLWSPDGVESLVEITAPKTLEPQLTKNISQSEAEQRLGYLANIVDTQGWSIRGVGVPPPIATAVKPDVYFEAQQAEDILDNNAAAAQSFDHMIRQSDEQHRQKLVTRMKEPVAATPAASPAQVMSEPTEPQNIQFNPYPSDMRQAVIQPLADDNQSLSAIQEPPVAPSIEPPVNTSGKAPSPAIIKLASNPDLSVQTIAHEAHRIQEQEDEGKEVIISLR